MRIVFLIALAAFGCSDDSNVGNNNEGNNKVGKNDVGRDLRSREIDAPEVELDLGMDASSHSCTKLNKWEQMMLDAHNRWRANVDPAAGEMHRVHWDTSIAKNAAAWVASCNPDWPHSSEKARSGIGGYDILGENLSYCAGSACEKEAADGSGTGDGEGWWKERHDYNWENDTSQGVTAHYTQMVSSNVYAIGCATQRCNAPGPSGWDGEWWWTICQYGPRGGAYWTGNKPYKLGDGSLIEPNTAVYADHPGLCK